MLSALAVADYGVTKYDLGNGLNHFGLAVPNVQATLNEIRKKGFPAPESTSKDLNGNVYAMIKDPTGYPFKLIQRAGMRERLWQVSFKVGDIGAAILFYQDAYGMFLLARNDYPLKQKTYAYMAYNLDDTMTTVIEFEYDYGVTEYNHGNGYAQLTIGTEDVYKTANAVELQHGKTTRPPGPLPGIPTKIYGCLDPDAWKVVFVDNRDFSREQEPSSFIPRVTTSIELERNSAWRCLGFDPMFDKPPGGF
ncbi:hypothetical protein M758_5G058200 [Ceratodon purpureus]|nr:hypothetical protein M758_5G058200 [Ceratodon purpureus]KAG0615674.1 hypothetical protein M758_5G058200 [Ceratodon purpureus]